MPQPFSDDDSRVSINFGIKASLPQTQSVPAVFYNTTRLYWLFLHILGMPDQDVASFDAFTTFTNDNMMTSIHETRIEFP